MVNRESRPPAVERKRPYWTATTIAIWIFVAVEAVGIAWVLANR